MKKLLLIIFFYCLLFSSSAQNQGNIWYFGYQAGLNFNSGAPVVIMDGMTGSTFVSHVEGTSVIADSSGNLLFYTDGERIWNRNHQLMPNGTGLRGLYSSTQTAIIVPDPAEPSRFFYVFTVDCGFPLPLPHAGELRYSIVDLCMEGGFGDIVPSTKNTLLTDSVPEKLIVTRHSNNIDYWILTHKVGNNNFCAFRLTPVGITDTIISSVGASLIQNEMNQGQMKFSPDGQRIAFATTTSEILGLFDFNNTTGVVSNPLDLYTPFNDNMATYGVEFSPDGSKLYINGYNNQGMMANALAQYDLNAGNISAINASLNNIIDNVPGTIMSALQIGPDNKIYMVSFSSIKHLAVINSPNLLGANCNYQDSAIYLNGRTASLTLPSFINAYDYSNNQFQCETTNTINELFLPSKQLKKVVDLMGRETEDKTNTILIYIYSDGTAEKVFKIE